jgi:hypothetical protein
MMPHAHTFLWNTRLMAIATWNDYEEGNAIERGLAKGTPG